MLLIDSHVHIYDCFDCADLLEAAADNFRAFAGNAPFTGVLMLTETSRDNWFEECVSGLSVEGWSFSPAADGISVWARHLSGSELCIVAGHQAVSKEGLEVLALGTRATITEDQSLFETVESVARVGALPVVPWAAGKWIGRRGKLIDRLLDAKELPQFILGDNGGRPFFWPEPAQFKRAREKGIGVLPGSDPLPLPHDFRRAGSFGVRVDATISRESPGGNLVDILTNRNTSVTPFGRLETFFGFVRNQAMIRLRA